MMHWRIAKVYYKTIFAKIPPENFLLRLNNCVLIRSYRLSPIIKFYFLFFNIFILYDPKDEILLSGLLSH
jgi:hypothetical protein